MSSSNNKNNEGVTRRDFLKLTAAGVAGLVIGGALGRVTAPVETITKTETETVTKTVAPTKTFKVFATKPELCTGCGLCEFICALTWEGKPDPRYSRIRVKSFWGGLVNVPNVCIPCTEKHCVNVCPEKALSFDKESGGIVLDESKCIKCYKCVDACPANAVYIHPEKGTPLICLKCGKCTEICPANAIVGEFEELSALSGLLTFESALARPPEEKAKLLLKAWFGVEKPEDLDEAYFLTEDKIKKLLSE